MMRKTLLERMLSFREIDENGCWNWTGTKVGSLGYGQTNLGKKRLYAHRAAFELWKHPIPDGMFVCHRCDNPRCFNPDHLFLGTQTDNMRDQVAKGRHYTGERPRGSGHGNATITEDDVRAIRARYAAGASQPKLAREYGQTQCNISKIVLRKFWRHVE